MKKLILPIAAVATLIGIVAISYNTESIYKQRSATENIDQAQVPGDKMAWAKIDLATGEYNPTARSLAHQQILEQSQSNIHTARASEKISDIEFTQKGPDNVGGRTRAILEVFKKPDTLLVGSVSGGLYISYNAGGTWERHEQFSNLDSSSSIISAIHQDTNSNPRRIYVGTGCDFDDVGPGFGIYVSEDDGVTFKHLTSTTPTDRFSNNAADAWVYVNRIRTDGDGNIFAATGKGLKRSTDDGETWEDVIFLDEAGTLASQASFADVLAMKSGRIVASTKAGAIYISETNGEPKSFEVVDQAGMPKSGLGRTVLSYSRQNEDHIYAMLISSNSCLNSVWETTTGGKAWTSLLVQFEGFEPMNNGDYCQGIYDAAFGVSPLDENFFFLGGITLWRYDGNLTRIASEGGSPPFQDVLSNYVHADKHYVYFSPNNERRAYITSDGGIAMTENRGATWQGINKDYISTQYYSVAHAAHTDVIMGGTQDNGTLITPGENENDYQIGFSLTGGDGIDVDMSQFSEIIFTSSQNGVVSRIDGSQRSGNSFAAGRISTTGGPFHTVLKLWENSNDPTSKDSVEFSVEATQFAFEVSNGVVKNYSATITPVQPNAEVVRSSIAVFAGSQLLTVSEDDETVLEGNGATEGTIAYNDDGSFDVDVTFKNAPAENTPIEVRFDKRFNANDIIYLKSENLRSGPTEYVYEYRLENNLNPGDIITVQDPVQAVLAHTGGIGEATTGGIRLVRNPLDFNTVAEHIDVPGISGSVSCVIFSKDGNTMFVGTRGGSLFRVVGVNNVYTEDDVDQLTVNNLQNFSGGITGVTNDPNDENHLVVTTGGYNSSSNVWESSNALGGGNFTSIHGDLAPIPVYEAIIDRTNPNVIIIATEFGIWATEQGGEAAPEWIDINDDLTYVPTYAIRQQGLPFKEASNSGMIFVGTYGAGLWVSESRTPYGITAVEELESIDRTVTGLKVFPNPMNDQGTIVFESSFDGKADMQIFDINGRMVYSKQSQVIQGENRIALNTSQFPTGTYYATITSDGKREVAKMMVFR